jgi:hypothetical protein
MILRFVISPDSCRSDLATLILLRRRADGLARGGQGGAGGRGEVVGSRA